MLNLSTFGNTADVCVIVHLVPHECQHIMVSHICYYCLLVANLGNCALAFPLKKLEFLSLYWCKNYRDLLRCLFVVNF
jgi:hypothetical protein